MLFAAAAANAAAWHVTLSEYEYHPCAITLGVLKRHHPEVSFTVVYGTVPRHVLLPPNPWACLAFPSTVLCIIFTASVLVQGRAGS